MYWRATMNDGTIKQHIHHDLHGPAVAHHSLDPAQVKRFEIIEGNQAVWGMDGMPRNVRKRTAVTPANKNLEIYVVVLQDEVKFVFADGRMATLPEFLPVLERIDGKIVRADDKSSVAFPLQLGTATIKENGDVTIEDTSFPAGYQFFTPIDQHHPREKPADLRPDPRAAKQ